jgi:phosphate starvation-inducible PhoH-like protein
MQRKQYKAPAPRTKTSFITAKTENQRNYIQSIIENDITICSGPSGTGKSLVALGIALEHIKREDKPQKQIYITRPMVATSQREFPHLKGTLIEKLEPYFAPILANLRDLLGSSQELEKMIQDETIVMQAIELARGMTFKNCFVLITESQNMTVPQSVMAITRLGENCKMIIEGDTDQKDIEDYDGLSYLRSRLKNCHNLCGMVSLTEKDILRHPLIGKILAKLDYKGACYDYSDFDR